MIKFEKFTEEILENLEREYPDKKVRLFPVLKNNGEKLAGLHILSRETNVCPTIYLDYYYSEFVNGTSLEKILRDIIDVYEKNKVQEMVDISKFLNYETAKNQIVYKLVNYERNYELLRDVPHIRFLDLAITFSYVFSMEQETVATALIHNSHLADWKKTVHDLFQVAEINTPRIFKYTLSSIEEVLAELLKMEAGEFENPIPMYVLSNNVGISGATVMIYKGMLKEISERMQSDIYILPSSIHETLLVPVYESGNEQVLADMVREVNATKLCQNEILSDNVYFYSRKENEIIVL